MPRPGRPKGQPHSGGRLPGVPNKATQEIKALARVHGPRGVERLAEIAFGTTPDEIAAVEGLRQLFNEGAAKAKIAKFARASFNARSDQTCVSAIKELFDRGYGKSLQPIAGDAEGGPIAFNGTLIYSGALAESDENK